MKRTISVANMVLLNENEQVLLLRRSSFLQNALKWGLPGGLIDANENPREAAGRELEEETGISRNTLVIEKIAQFALNLPDENISMYTVRARSKEVEPTITLSEEHVDYGWFGAHDIGAIPDAISGLLTIIAGTVGESLPANDPTLPNHMTVNRII